MTEESFDELIARSRDELDREERDRQERLRITAEAQRLVQQERASQEEAYAQVAATTANDIARVYQAIREVEFDEWVIDRAIFGSISRELRNSPRLSPPYGSSNSPARQKRNAKWIDKQTRKRQSPHVRGAWNMRFGGYLLTADADVVNMHVSPANQPMGSTLEAPLRVEFISLGSERRSVTEDHMRDIRIGLARLATLHELPIE